MKAEDRTKYAMKALGWQGGTVHDLCREIECDVHDFLYESAIDVGVMGSEFTQGWFAIRTCKPGFFLNTIAPKKKGNLQFWFGVMAGLAIDD